MNMLDMPTVPEKCIGCAVQCDLIKDIGALMLLQDISTRGAESLVGDVGEEFDELVKEELGDEESAENLLKSIRKGVGDTLDDMDSRINELREQSAVLSLSCDGVLKMRASKAGKTYTASICTSASKYLVNNDKPKHIPVHISVNTL